MKASDKIQACLLLCQEIQALKDEDADDETDTAAVDSATAEKAIELSKLFLELHSDGLLNPVFVVSPWTYVQNQGDGGVVILFYNHEGDAEHDADKCDERYSDDVEQTHLQIDRETGHVKKVHRRYDGTWGD